MRFIDREEEMARLDRLARRREGGLAVVWGRRRVGKTRLLIEWSRRHRGGYFVADQSTPEVQRRYFAEAIAQVLAGFADVEYREWSVLLARLAREAAAAGWRGPVIVDELPYLSSTSPELASVLQRWIDHEAREARLVVALAGSSQRMMQGLALSANAPLYGRASELLELAPLDPAHMSAAFATTDPARLIQLYAAWGGVPRYWELAAEMRGEVRDSVDRIVLDPLGPLHREPDRLLLEELPPALEVRPILDAIGAGAHRVSEIAGRIGRPATSLSRPLERLRDMGLVRRDVPFGESEKQSRRSLYVIEDPFFRLWFRVVAAHRGALAAGNRNSRMQLLGRHWPHLVARAWEDLCRRSVPHLKAAGPAAAGPWGPAARWWDANVEWDVVSENLAGTHLLLGEAKWSERALAPRQVEMDAERFVRKPAPVLPARFERHQLVRVLFIPRIAGRRPRLPAGVVVATYADTVGIRR